MTVTLAQRFVPWNETVTESQGSAQNQSNGNYLVCSGQVPFFGEYTSDGSLLYSVQFGVSGVESYRVLRHEWTGYPTTTPAVVALDNSTTMGYDVYTSWNGATEISHWVLYGLDDASSWANATQIAYVEKTTFETAFSIDSAQASNYSYIQAEAVASDGTVLGTSDYVALGTSPAVSLSLASFALGARAVSSTSTATAVSTSSASSTRIERVGAHAGLLVLVLCIFTLFI